MGEAVYISEWLRSEEEKPCVYIDVTVGSDENTFKRRFCLSYVEVAGRKYIFFFPIGAGFHNIENNPQISFEFSSSKNTPPLVLAKQGICLVVNQFRDCSEIQKEFRRIYSEISFSHNIQDYIWCEVIETTIELFESGVKYGLVPRPKNFTEFAEVLHWYTPELHLGNSVFWRGMACIEWELDSTLGRKAKQDLIELWKPRGTLYDDASQESDPRGVELQVLAQEGRLLEDARREGYGYLSGRRLSDLELLSVLQHNGAATRLIDFTEDPFIALWFATREAIYAAQDGILLMAIPNHCRCENCHDPYIYVNNPSETPDSITEIIALNQENGTGEEYYFWKPTKLYDRMKVQKSILFLGRHLDDSDRIDGKWKHWGPHVFQPNDFNSIGDLDVSPVHFRAIAIPPELKRDMEAKWALFGFNIRTMFPDLSGFAQHWSYTPPRLNNQP
jgi:hypothetical protein